MNRSADTTPATQQPGRVSAGALVRWTASALLLTAAVSAALIFATGSADWREGFLASTVIALPCALAGLFPVLLFASRGGNAAQIAYGFLAGTFLRMVAALACLLVATRAAHAPKVPTVLLVLAYYAAMLSAEVGALVAQMRRAFPVDLSKARPLAAA